MSLRGLVFIPHQALPTLTIKLLGHALVSVTTIVAGKRERTKEGKSSIDTLTSVPGLVRLMHLPVKGT